MPTSDTRSQAEKQAAYKKGVDESVQNILDLVRGVIKGATTDLPGFIMDVADKLAGDTTTLGEKNRSSQLFEKITGSKPTGSTAENLGSMISPGDATLAMIVGAARMAKAGKMSKGMVNTAEEMIAEGESRANTFYATGVYKDLDGQRKTVLSDADAKVNLDPLQDIKWFQWPPVHLPDVLEHPELYDIYPELRTVQINQMIGMPGEASFTAATDKLGYMKVVIPSTNSPVNEDALKSTLLHETQHAIQSIENFTRGGNSEMFRRYNVDTASVRKKLDTAKVSSDPAVAKAAERFRAKINVDATDAYQKYLTLGGEQEARYTQITRGLNQPILEKVTQQLLKSGKTPQSRE